MSRHIFTKAECSKGGRERAKLPGFSEHCQEAFQILQVKRPDVARAIYKYRVKPYMQKRYSSGNSN